MLLVKNISVVVLPRRTYQDPDGQCVECFACDRACPMNLDVREQAHESFCSNCTLCIDACRNVLGDGNEVITQMREDELPEELQE